MVVFICNPALLAYEALVALRRENHREDSSLQRTLPNQSHPERVAAG